MEQNYYFKNSFSRFIEICGEDRSNFLQGLITNDINKCNKNNAIYSCFLSPQGKFLADFFIINIGNSYLIEIHEKFFKSFLLKLKIYKLKSKIIFKENINFLSLIIFTNNDISLDKDIIFFKDPRNENLGTKVYYKIGSNDLKILKNLKKKKLKYIMKYYLKILFLIRLMI